MRPLPSTFRPQGFWLQWGRAGTSGHMCPKATQGNPNLPMMEARVQGLEKAVSSLQVGAAEQKTLSQQLLEQGKQTQEMVRVMAASMLQGCTGAFP